MHDTNAPASAGPVTQPVSSVRGTSRVFPIPACRIEREDIRRLYQLLDAIAQDAAEREVATLQTTPGQTNQQFRQAQDTLRSSMRLGVQIQTENGEVIRSTDRNVLEDDELPDAISQVAFDSAYLHQLTLNRYPQNFCRLTLDFSAVDIFDLAHSASTPTANQSQAAVTGLDATWVNGVYSQIEEFFEQRRRAINWLHGRNVYDLALFLFAFPIALYWVYFLNAQLDSLGVVWPPVLHFGVHVYVFLAVLYIFRLTFNYARWVFPKIEGPHTKGKTHRAILIALVLSLLSGVIYNLLIEPVLNHWSGQ